MSVKKELFEQTGDYLMATLQNPDTDHPYGAFDPALNLPGLKHFDKQMGQFNNPEMFNAIPLPCILMEYQAFDWKTIGKNQQKGNGIIRFYIYYENYADSFNGSVNESIALNFFLFTEEVHKSLNGLSLPNMAALERIGDNEDSAQDMIVTSTVDYATVINDSSSDFSRKFVLTDPAVKVEKVHQTSRPANEPYQDGFITQ
jgi:hypothetical protein